MFPKNNLGENSKEIGRVFLNLCPNKHTNLETSPHNEMKKLKKLYCVLMTSQDEHLSNHDNECFSRQKDAK